MGHRHLFGVLADIVGVDRPQKREVLLGMELGHLVKGRRCRAVNLHLFVQAIVEQQVVRHADAVRLPATHMGLVSVSPSFAR